MDFSIIIPSKGHSLGVWATICACEVQLKNSGHSYEYCIIANGDDTEADDIKHLQDFLTKENKLGYYYYTKESLAPPTARTLGVENSRGNILVFFDNHCIPDSHYFDYTKKLFDDSSIDILHSSVMFYPGQGINYHYRLLLDNNFWGEYKGLPQSDFMQYKIAASGHGGFMVRRDCWNELGGYGPNGLLVGYGGEELIFDLKAWRLNKKVWLHPKILHYHSSASRGYSKCYTDEYYINLMTSALVIGGEKWLNTTYNSFATKGHIRSVNVVDRNTKTMFDLYEEAYIRGIEYSKYLDSIATYSLDNLLNNIFLKESVEF